MGKKGDAFAAASQQTRQDLLAAGLRLLIKLPAAAAFGHLTANRVATEAGRTTGAFFHQWPTIDAYLQDFLGYVLRPDMSVNLAATVADLQEGLARGSSFAEAVVAAGSQAPQRTALDPQSTVELLALNRATHDERFRAEVARHYAELDTGVAATYGALAALLGREPRPPFTPEMMGALLSGVAQGLAVRTTLTPGFYPDQLFGWVTLALIPLLTREPGDERDAAAYVEDLPLSVRTSP